MNIWTRLKGILRKDEAEKLNYKKHVWASYVLDNCMEDARGLFYITFPSRYTRSKSEEGMFLSVQELRTLQKAARGR